MTRAGSQRHKKKTTRDRVLLQRIQCIFVEAFYSAGVFISMYDLV